MRYKEIKPLQEQTLFEINMSPKSLEQLASKISARAGLEFEMIVPNTENSDRDDSEPDYDSDEGVSDIDDAVRFFHDGDLNDRSVVNHLRRAMQEDYQEWFDEKLSDLWYEDGEEYLREWIKSNVSEDEWNDPDIGGPELDSDSRLDIFAADAWKNQNSYYDDAREEFEQERADDLGQSEWLDDQGLNAMSNISDTYNGIISWPHYQNYGNGGRTTSEVADSFDDYLGRGVKVGGYHGVDRNTSAYIVEPDGSLEPDDTDDTGLEFVSPPLSIPEMIEDLKKVAAWAKAEGCYTNDSTGLHMNISVENFDKEDIDYIKLAVLCGDEYVLKEFGRMSNTYAASAIGKVKNLIRDNPDRAAEVLAKMKSHLEQGADRAVEGTTRNIHPNYTQKYTSINLKDNRIEFRSPGGDWLGEYRRDPGKLVNTMLRFVVALDAAMDPEKYRKEYLTKLYKLLNPKGQRDEYGEMVEQFAKYVTGVGGAPEQVVREFRRMALSSLTGKGLTPPPGVKALTGRPHDPNGQIGIFDRDNRSYTTPYFRFSGVPEDRWKYVLQAWAARHNVNVDDYKTAPVTVATATEEKPPYGSNQGQTVAPQATATIRDTPAFDQRQLHYEVFDREDPEQDTIEVVHGTISEIAAMLEHMAARRNVPRTRLGIRPIGHTATGSEAGAEQPQPPRQATAPNGVPLWEVYERDSGNVVYTFPDHNQQSAWSTAQAWLRAHAEPAAASGFSCRPKMETN